MPRKKYDWEALKLKFFKSKEKSPKKFLQDLYGTYTGTMRTKTSWWVKEKDEYMKKNLRKAKQTAEKELEEENKERWLQVYSEMNDAEIEWLTKLIKSIRSKSTLDSEIRANLTFFRLIKWESTMNTWLTWSWNNLKDRLREIKKVKKK